MDEAILTRREIRRRAAIIIWEIIHNLGQFPGLKYNDQVNQVRITGNIRFICTRYGNARWNR